MGKDTETLEVVDIADKAEIGRQGGGQGQGDPGTEAGLENKSGFITVSSRAEAADLVVSELRSFLDKSYGEKLPYHNLGHSERLAEGVSEHIKNLKEKFGEGLISREDEFNAPLICYGHDLIVRSLIANDPKAGGERRFRFRGGELGDLQKLIEEDPSYAFVKGKIEEEPNQFKLRSLKDLSTLDTNDNELSEGELVKTFGNELASAVMLYNVLGKYRLPGGEKAFDMRLRDIVDIIKVTYVEAGVAMERDSAGTQRLTLKVDQPYLTVDSSVLQFLVANEDLRGMCGRKPFEEYAPTSDAEFRETYVWIQRALDEKGIAGIEFEDRALIAKSMLNWAKLSEGFVLWQKGVFGTALEANKQINQHEKREEIKGYFKGEFDEFDANAKKARERYEEMERKYGMFGKLKHERLDQDEIFEALLKEFGYNVEVLQRF